MQPMQARIRFGWREQEWREVDAAERSESTRRVVAVLAPSAVVAAAVSAIFPFTPGFSKADTAAAVVAAIGTALIALAVVPSADRLARGLPYAGAGDSLVFTVALSSAGAAAIHFSVARTHFAEYTLFGVFFVGSAIAQLVWPLWLLLRRWRPLLVLGALGNSAIVALWVVDRVWGLPLGPTRGKPDPVGFGDSVASAFELLLVVGCVALLVRGPGGLLRRANALALTLAAVALTALSMLSVLGVGSSFLTPTE